MKTAQFIYHILIVLGLTLVFLLNQKIYNLKWFKVFIPISFVLILIGFLIKDYFEVNYYKLLIVLPIFVYFIKLTQIGFGYFNQKYTINIRGFEDREKDFFTMDTMVSFVLMGIYGFLYLIF
jgi:hypothetical protein